MTTHDLTDELSDLRAQIARLQRREACLERMLRLAGDSTPAPPVRPGWPIRRLQADPVAMH